MKPSLALVLLAAALLVPSIPSQGAGGQAKTAKKSTLEVAKSLADGQFKDATYGYEGTKGQVNDASFLVSVLDGCGAKLDAATKESILKISKLGSDTKQAQALVEKNDSQLGGVVDVLVKNKLAKKVELADVQVGDLIQYWKRNDKKEWYGYAFLIDSVEKDKSGQNPKVKLYGAHEGNAKIGKSGTVGVSRFDLVLKDEEDRKIFLARLDSSALGGEKEPPAVKKEKETPPVKRDPPPVKKEPAPKK